MNKKVTGIEKYGKPADIENSDVRDKVKAAGLDPDDFEAQTYEFQMDGETRFITVFETGEGMGNAVIPHWSSVDDLGF